MWRAEETTGMAYFCSALWKQQQADRLKTPSRSGCNLKSEQKWFENIKLKQNSTRKTVFPPCCSDTCYLSLSATANFVSQDDQQTK